jgi:hypothetical protein
VGRRLPLCAVGLLRNRQAELDMPNTEWGAEIAATECRRAAAASPTGAPRSARERQQVIDRLLRLVEHGLESTH